MRNLFFGVIALVILFSSPALAADFPKQATYLIYVAQKPVGKSVVQIEQTGKSVIFTSENLTETADFYQQLKCRTEIDRETFRAKRFQYEGRQNDQIIDGEVWSEGPVFKGHINIDGNSFPSEKPGIGLALFYQNYVIDNQIAWLHAVVNAERGMLNFSAILPSDFMFNGVSAFVESELEVRTPKGPRICAKVQFTLEGSTTFWGYLDLDTGIAIYFDYPQQGTEVFLVDAYGEKPTPKYTTDTPDNASDHDDHEGHNH